MVCGRDGMRQRQPDTQERNNYDDTNPSIPNHRPEKAARRTRSPSPSPTTAPRTAASPEDQNLPVRKQGERRRSASEQLDPRKRPKRDTVLELPPPEMSTTHQPPRRSRGRVSPLFFGRSVKLEN